MPVASRKPVTDSTPPFRSVAFLLSSLGYAVSRRFHEILRPLELECEKLWCRAMSFECA